MLGGVESLGISKAGQTFSPGCWSLRYGTSLQALWYCWGEGLEEGQLPLLALMPDTSVSPSMSWVSFKLLLWYWRLEGVSLSEYMFWFFKGNCVGLQKFLPMSQPPLVFLQPEVGETYIPGTRTLGWGSWYGAGSPYSRDIPSEFLSITYE